MPVSVVISTKNMAQFLRFAIESVRQQTYSAWDLHIVDNCSTDSTAALVAEYRGDQRIHYWPQKTDEKQAAGRNRGISCSSNDYVAFLDADDMWEVDKLRKQVDALESDREAALCYTYTRYVDQNGAWLERQVPLRAADGYVLQKLIRGNFITISSVIVRREALESVGFFDTDRNLLGSEDWDLWLRIASKYPIKLVPEELTRYRVYDPPRSQQLILNGAIAVLNKHYKNPNFSEQAGIGHRKALALAYLASAGFASASVQRSVRLNLLVKAVSISPTALASSAGILAIARLLLPFPVVTKLKRLVRDGGKIIQC